MSEEQTTPDVTPPLADLERRKHTTQLLVVVVALALLLAGVWWIYQQSQQNEAPQEDRSAMIESRLEASRNAENEYTPTQEVVDRLEASRTEDGQGQYVPSAEVAERLNNQ